jgi:hypothetical protein
MTFLKTNTKKCDLNPKNNDFFENKYHLCRIKAYDIRTEKRIN